MKHILFSSLLLIVTSFSLSGQTHYFTARGTEFIQLHSEETGRDYELLVKLPNSYKTSPDRKYPVIYLTDAQWDMALVTNILGKLRYDNHLPEMIIVGITYPGENANYGSMRTRDLTPTHVASRAGSGDGFKFLQFIEDSIIPTIESKYRADPRYRALAGVSLGGLFAIHAAIEKPTLFGRYISISPAVAWDNNYLIRRDEEYAQNNTALPARLYITYGSDEFINFREPIHKLQKQLNHREYDSMKLKTDVVEGARHGSAAIEGFMRGLLWVFNDIHTGRPDPLEVNFNRNN